MTPDERNKYYLEVVKEGGEPEWPRPKEELVIGSQDLEGGYTQYFAYHVDSGKNADDLPPAEIVASENPTPKAAILIDQPHPIVEGNKDEEVLELILSKDGHAFAHTASSLDSLEDNISAILKLATDRFNMEVEHFMTTDRVSEDVEKKLDSLEDSEGGAEEEGKNKESGLMNKEEDKEDVILKGAERPIESEKQDPIDPPGLQDDNTEEEIASSAVPPRNDDARETAVSDPDPEPDLEPIPHVQHHVTSSQIYSSSNRAPLSGDSSGGGKKWILIPVILLLALFGGALYFREALFSGLNKVTATPTPTPPPAEPTATPTPTPAVERKEYKVRVLNGTTTSGAAASLGDKLKELGWEINRVGNNSTQDVAKGFVRSKPKLETAVSVMINDLGGSFEASTSALKETDNVDLEVVIGKE